MSVDGHTVAEIMLRWARPFSPLGLVAFNALFWTRGRALPEAASVAPGGVSVLIPARDEVANIERCVRAADAASGPITEIVVYDDGSTDGTAEALSGFGGRSAAAAGDPR